MPLESCMILLDNSEYMRNGDYIPTRLEAQQDAANLLVGAKTQSHPESTVGVSAGTELLVSPTDDVGKILSALHGLPLRSMTPDVPASVQVASLALKHRRNKNGAQRIVLFVGSPLSGIESRALAKVGRQLKKNNVAIDVVLMGEVEDNEGKLRELVDAANGRSDDGGERTCHLVTIPAGVLPSDVLASSPIVHGAGGGGFAPAGAGSDFGAGAFAEFGGVDPSMDPELAMALRVSMEEERARQERAAAAAAAAAASNQGGGDAVMTDANAANNAAVAAAMDVGLSEEEALLQQALAMSMNENDPPGEEESKQEEDAADSGDTAEQMETEDVDDDEDAAMQMALQMSMQTDSDDKPDGAASTTAQQQQSTQFQDPQFVNQLLGTVPGVDPNDPAIQNALRNAQEGEKKSDDQDPKDSTQNE